MRVNETLTLNEIESSRNEKTKRATETTRPATGRLVIRLKKEPLCREREREGEKETKGNERRHRARRMKAERQTHAGRNEGIPEHKGMLDMVK